jgi:hypothetical protein
MSDPPTKRQRDSDRAERPSAAAITYSAGPPRLQQYLNGRVTIYYNTYSAGYQDSGVLTLMDETWVELTKDNQERLLIPIVAIRIIKLLEPAQLEDESTVLLRPFEGRRDEQKQIAE